MKITILFSAIFFAFLSPAFSQISDFEPANSSNITSSENKEADSEKLKSHYDSIWSFHPTSIGISVGLWFPTGKLHEYYNPSFQLGAGVGLRLSKKMRLELLILPRFINDKKHIQIMAEDSLVNTGTDMGGSIGGMVTHEIFRNKLVYTELAIGANYEFLDTKTKRLNPKASDSSVGVSVLGFSVGVNSWINAFKRGKFWCATFISLCCLSARKYTNQ